MEANSSWNLGTRLIQVKPLADLEGDVNLCLLVHLVKLQENKHRLRITDTKLNNATKELKVVVKQRRIAEAQIAAAKKNSLGTR